MVAGQRLDDSEHEGPAFRGLLFRIGARIAAVVFVIVLAIGLTQGVEPTTALIRALLALVGLAACGWLAEQVAGSVAPDRPAPDDPDAAGDEEA